MDALDRTKSLTKQLDAMHPGLPKCKETAMKTYQVVDRVLTQECDIDGFKGLTYLEALTVSKVKHAIKHPESTSLGDIAKITAPKKETEQGEDTGSKLLDLFNSMDEVPDEVIDPQ